MDRQWRKLILLISLLLIPSLLYAMPLWMVGGSPPVATCPSGTYKFAWTGDYAGGSTVACLNSGASTLTGTQTGGTLSTDYGVSGIGYNSTLEDDRITWAITADNIWDDVIGTVCASIKTGTADGTDNRNYIDVYADTNNRRLLFVTYNDDWRENGLDNAAGVQWDSEIYDFPNQTWTRVCYAWDEANNHHAYKIGEAGSYVEADNVNLQVWGTAPASFRIGELYSATQSDIDIDSVFVMGTYQATDPGP